MTQSVDTVKVMEPEKLTNNQNASKIKAVQDNSAEVNDVNGGTADKGETQKCENKLPLSVPTLPTHEKILYDNRIRRKNVLALNEKVAAIREYEKSPVYKRVGRIFHCSPDQIKRIVQQKDSILEAWEQRTRRCHDAKTLEMKVVRVSMLGKAVYEWLRRMIYYQDIQITDGLIQKTALQFKSAMGLQNFFPHQDWCDKFRYTYKIHTADSKMLKIGHTQGYSVQIKDVMKDVLNECTPDGGDRNQMSDDDNVEGEEDLDGEDFEGDEHDDIDDDDDEDDVQEIKGDERSGEKTQNQETKDDKEIKAEATSAKRGKFKHSGDGPNTKSNASAYTANFATVNVNTVVNRTGATSTSDGPKTSNVISTSNNGMKSASPQLLPKVPTPQLPPLRQLVALPLQGNVAGMPQKVLVATPITPAGQVSGAKPMTMTIIPLATIAQSQSMQQGASDSASASTATANALTAALATTSATAATPATDAEKSAVPMPMLEVKKEIKEEPIEVKQECVTDDDDDDDNKKAEQEKETSKQSKINDAQRCHENSNPPTAPVTSKSSYLTKKDEHRGSEHADDENIALANLRRLIQTQGKIVATATTSAGASMTASASEPRLAPKPTLTHATLVPFSSSDRQRLPTSTTAITCIPAANLTAMTTKSLSFTPPLPPLTKAPDAVINRLANKRKHPGNNTPIAPPIKSCTEARKYLKLLEDFALVKENFRLIGLITRSDEILRELDGNDDVDID
ncbi:uncharacterized protein ebd1 [Eurosta solidaginis]|uniref:uncharacterized protein ebd1 n=1 Tax=Eurosta solidaginis TaxID=178769 RepID=UPI003530DBD0